MSDEKSDIPATVTGRDRINNARVQSAVIGSTKIFTTNLLNETRFSFSRNAILSGLPELSFNVNGQKQALPQFILSPTRSWAAAGAIQQHARRRPHSGPRQQLPAL